MKNLLILTLCAISSLIHAQPLEYIALVSQQGINAPIVGDEIVNTLGETPTFERQTNGQYKIVCSVCSGQYRNIGEGLFPYATDNSANIWFYRIAYNDETNDGFFLDTFILNTETGQRTYTDGLLYHVISFKVYP